MFATLQNYLRRRKANRPAWAATHGNPPPGVPRPPTPDGWTIVPHATPGVTAYEVSSVLRANRPIERRAHLGGADMVGLNSTEYHGFPAETLEIGNVAVRIAGEPGSGDIRITYRLHYDPRGRRKGSLIPSFDYHRLPVGDAGPAAPPTA